MFHHLTMAAEVECIDVEGGPTLHCVRRRRVKTVGSTTAVLVAFVVVVAILASSTLGEQQQGKGMPPLMELLQQGDAAVAQKKNQKAIELFTQVLGEAPKREERETTLCIHCSHRSNACFCGPTERSPKSDAGYLKRANAYIQAKRPADALKDLDTLLSFDPTSRKVGISD